MNNFTRRARVRLPVHSPHGQRRRALPSSECGRRRPTRILKRCERGRRRVVRLATHLPRPTCLAPACLLCCSARWPYWLCAGPSRAAVRRPSRSAPGSTRDAAHTPPATSVAEHVRHWRSTGRRTRPRPIPRSRRCLIHLPLSITSFPSNSRLAPHRRRLARAKREPRREDVRTPRMVHQITLTDYRPPMNSMLWAGVASSRVAPAALKPHHAGVGGRGRAVGVQLSHSCPIGSASRRGHRHYAHAPGIDVPAEPRRP
jgi:hypothetical protein